MFFIFKIKHFKIFFLILILFILSNCQFKEPIKGHGINFLENRSNKITLKKTNKNDVIQVLGNPHTKSIDNENLWFYFDRKLSNGSIIDFSKNRLLENNVLIIGFDKYGIVDKKELFNKKDMQNIIYTEMKTENPVSSQSFVSKFLHFD